MMPNDHFLSALYIPLSQACRWWIQHPLDALLERQFQLYLIYHSEEQIR